jgi:ureidoacrylate peracid hydrolase
MHGIHRLFTMGLIYGAELGYDITVVKDATASYSDREMRAAIEVNLPNFASASVTADEIVEAIAAR